MAETLTSDRVLPIKNDSIETVSYRLKPFTILHEQVHSQIQKGTHFDLIPF